MHYLDKIKKCNQYDSSDKIPFLIEDKRVGQVRKKYLQYLLGSGVFVYENNVLALQPSLDTYARKNEALDYFAKEAYVDGITNTFMDESYAIVENITSKPLCLIDRTISTLLGVLSFGQHLNGYVRTKDGMKMWIGKRASDRGYEAGKLDHVVAGGLPYGITMGENLEKECHEEAGMSKELANQAISVGLVAYRYDYDLGGKEDIIYCYDLELDEDFKPVCMDGEVEAFYLMDIHDVMEIVKNTDDFKLNCNLVLIDFFIRHGFIKPEDKDYIDLVRGLKGYK